MDSSTRAEVFSNIEEAQEYAEKWKNICYFICWFYINEWDFVTALPPNTSITKE